MTDITLENWTDVEPDILQSGVSNVQRFEDNRFQLSTGSDHTYLISWEVASELGRQMKIPADLLDTLRHTPELHRPID
jgi:hypothetical protein